MKLIQGLRVQSVNSPVIHLLAIAGLVFLIYSNTFNAPFQFDDDTNIVHNPAIKDLHYFSDPSRVELIDNSIGFSKPLFKTRYIGYLSFAINYTLHGLDVWGYHLVNILIHIFNSLLLYWLITLTFRTPFFTVVGRPLPDRSSNFIALFTALFFAVHPIQTQAVTYIVQRFASLATLFYLLSLVMYIKWRELKEEQTKRYMPCIMLYAVSLLSAVLAMKTKEFAFTLPIVMAVYELMFFDGNIIKRLLYLVPFLLAVLLIPLSLTGTEGALSLVSGINEEAADVSGASGNISRADYLFTQFRVIVTYIRLLFLPINQNIDYDYPIYNSFFDPAVVLSFVSLLSVIITGIYLYRFSKRPDRRDRCWLRLLSFGIFWFFITLSPESSVIPIKDVIFEHRVYLPSIGFFIALTSSIVMVGTRWGNRLSYANKALVYVMLLAVIVLSAATYKRNSMWNDLASIWGENVEASDIKARPHLNLGVAYLAQGRIDEAISEFQTSLKLDPYQYSTHINLGLAYFSQGRMDEAVNEYQTVLKLSPDYSPAHYNLGTVYLTQGRLIEAISEFKIALSLNPDYPEAHYSIGNAYAKRGRIDEAILELNTSLRLNPYNAEAHYDLGVAYASQGRTHDAIKEYQAVLRLMPDHAQAHNNLGELLLKK
ncbi:MAG: tetratricopeptide repeat protein [Nitrospirae bacterium]|nr:tetratricopeptide repeat protein [Nitrospirota bacterium]